MAHAWDVMPGEGMKAYRAFRMYLQLGPARTLMQVSRDKGTTYPVVGTWSRKFKWTKRILAVEEAITNALVDSYTGAVKNNQNTIISDAFKDYEELLELWRIKVDQVRQVIIENPNAVNADDLTKLASTRRTIDDVGRRAAGLPGTIKETTNKDAGLPQVKQLGFLNGTARKLESKNDDPE